MGAAMALAQFATGAVEMGFAASDANEEKFRISDETEANIAVARRAAVDAYERAAHSAGKARTRGTQTMAAQRVAFANSGVDPTVGTAAQTMANTALMSELEAQTISNNAQREAWGFKMKEEELKRNKYAEHKRLDRAIEAKWWDFAARTVVGGGASAFNAGVKK